MSDWASERKSEKAGGEERRMGGKARVLIAVVAAAIMGCRADIVTSPAPAATVVASPSAPARSLPAVPGLSEAEVAGLASLEQVDGYPLYVMHLYGSPEASPAGSSAIVRERPAWGCSLFAAMGDPDHPLYGRNFDWSYSPALLLVNHPADGYDSVSMVDLTYFYDEDEVQGLANAPLADRKPLLETPGWPFDGMNEAGLAVGMAAVPDSPLPRDAGLPTLDSLDIIREMLHYAGDVDEALTLMQSYNVDMGGGPAIHYLIADAAGHASLVELYRGEIVVMPNAASWHLATNHYRAPLSEADTGGCWRYALLDEALAKAAGRLDVPGAMALLSDVAQPATQWSLLYDMGSREVHVAMGQAYERVHTFDLLPPRN